MERTRSPREWCSVDSFEKADAVLREWSKHGGTTVDVRIVWENGMRFEYGCETSDWRGVSGDLAFYVDLFHKRGACVDWSDQEVRRMARRCGTGGNQVVMASIAHSCETTDVLSAHA